MAERIEEEVASGPICERCARICEPLEVEECPICKKTFCIFCAYRIGSRNYCSRACGDAFFFSSDDDSEDLAEE
jgi:hypothetical protein